MIRRRRLGFGGAGAELGAATIATVAAVAVGAAVIAASGHNVIDAASALVNGVAGDQTQFRSTLDNATVLILAALAVSLPVRAGLFNIGGEGQLLMGALGAAFVGLKVGGLPAPVAFLLALAAGAVAGGLWGLIPGYLRSLGANEIITTLMFNFIALWGIVWLISGSLQAPDAVSPGTGPVQVSAELPNFPGTFVDVGIVIALLIAAVVLFIERRTVFGLELRLIGQSADGARFAGISLRRKIMLVMVLSGAIAGLGGAAQLLAVQYELTDQFSPGFGYLGIAIAFLGATSPLGIVLAGLFFGALTAGATNMELVAQVPAPVSAMIEGLAFAFVLFALTNRARLRERV
jgi:general nucleoside transport system permease protein